MSENHLRRALESGEFIYTAELVLSRDYVLSEVEQFVKDAAKASGEIKVISLTDLPSGNPAIPPESFASFIVEHKLTPLVHLTSKDVNRAFLEGRMYALARIGAENVLTLSGDAPTTGFKGKPKSVYDLDSVQFIRLITEMRKGISYQVGKRTLQTPPFNFFIGAVVNPFKIVESALMTQLYKLELKIRCGAQFFITQLGYNIRKLYELRQYMKREGLDHIPVLTNVYVPTATIARLMQSGEVPGCIIPDRFIQILGKEKKLQRLERAALMVAAAKELGFAGAHIGGFGLTHNDFLTIISKADEIGDRWRERMDELIFEVGADDFYLLPKGKDGLSDDSQSYNVPRAHPKRSFKSRIFSLMNILVVSERSPAGKYFKWRLKRLRRKYGVEGDMWRRGLTYRLLSLADVVKKYILGCVHCGDCIQDYIKYTGCSMGKCIKETRNGPCGGSRVDGTCEVNPDLQCVWNTAYLNLFGAGEDPRKFAYTLIPPREWNLNRTNSLANYLAEADSYNLRTKVDLKLPKKE